MRNSLAIFRFLIILCYIFPSCKGTDGEDVSAPVGIEQEMGKFVVNRTQRGHARWRLEADSADFLESGQIKIKGVNLIIFGDKGQTVNIRGNRGEFNRSSYNVKIEGNVEGTLSDGGYLATSEVYWNESQKKIFTPPGVKVDVSYKETKVTGEELEVLPLQEVVSLKSITGITQVKEEQETR